MKTVEVFLGYFKQGDDLNHCLGQVENPVDAIDLHADMLSDVVDHLDAIYGLLQGHDIEICADTHYISITCEDELADELVSRKLAEYIDWDDEDEMD